jgi:hypothetical protein
VTNKLAAYKQIGKNRACNLEFVFFLFCKKKREGRTRSCTHVACKLDARRCLITQLKKHKICPSLSWCGRLLCRRQHHAASRACRAARAAARSRCVLLHRGAAQRGAAQRARATTRRSAAPSGLTPHAAARRSDVTCYCGAEARCWVLRGGLLLLRACSQSALPQQRQLKQRQQQRQR